MAKATKKLERTAYHEAGHAVAAYLLSQGFKAVSIEPEGDTLGYVMPWATPAFRPDMPGSSLSRTRRVTEAKIQVSLAGSLAEYIYRGRRNHPGARADYGRAADLAMSACGSEEHTNAYLKWLGIGIELKLRHPPNWCAVKALAKALLKHKRLNSRQARQIIRKAMGQYGAKKGRAVAQA